MAPVGFNKYFLQIGAGRNRKFVKLTDSERCAHFLGVLALAAQSPRRGYLLVSESEEVTAEEVANEAGGGVTVRVAESALDKLKRRGVLVRDDEVGAWYVNDWHEINPDPRTDATAADRKRRQRDRDRDNDRDRHANGHAPVTRDSHANVTEVTQTEVEEEGEASSTTSQRNARRRAPSKPVDQASTPSKMPDTLRDAARAALEILHATWEQRGGLEPTVRGVALAVIAKPDRDHVQVAHDVEYWLISGNGREADCGDITARFRRFLASSPPARRSQSDNGTVLPFGRRAEVIQAANAWQNAPEYRDNGA